MTSPGSHTPGPPAHIIDSQAPAKSGTAPLERRGRRWIFGSFAFCPCHLPLTLGILGTVFGGTAAGAVLRDHIVLGGIVITAAWVAGTWRGFRLVRLGQQGACPLPAQAAGHTGQAMMSQDGPLGDSGHERSDLWLPPPLDPPRTVTRGPVRGPTGWVV